MTKSRRRANTIGVLTLGVVAGALAMTGSAPALAGQVGGRAAASAGVVVTAALPPTQIWVDPVVGNDAAAGTQAAPVRTISEAWARVPSGTPLTRGVTINLRPGTYPRAGMPNYWELRHGTAEAPIVLRSAGPARSAILLGDINLFRVDHLRLEGLSIRPGGDAVHCELCGNITIDNSLLDGRGPDGRGAAHETLKVNQSHDINVLRSTLTGAYENAIDFVAVQRSRIEDNEISYGEDWCAYVTGGLLGSR